MTLNPGDFWEEEAQAVSPLVFPEPMVYLERAANRSEKKTPERICPGEAAAVVSVISCQLGEMQLSVMRTFGGAERCSHLAEFDQRGRPQRASGRAVN